MLGAFRRVRRRRRERWSVRVPHLVFLGVMLAIVLSSMDLTWLGKSNTPGRPVSYPFGAGLALAGSCPPPNPCGYWDGSRWHCACKGKGGGHDKPPKISGTLNCSQSGNNGWCVGTETLELSASDPQGKQVQISGDVDGTAFACQNGNTSCSVPLPEGKGTTHFKAASMTGLSSSTKTQAYQRDSTSPTVNGTVKGTSGQNGWYVSSVGVTVSASDSLSGIASLEYALDGGSWTDYSGALTLDDGQHTLQFRATDIAGNQTKTSQQTIAVDTHTPHVDLNTTGKQGLHGWYVSNVQVSANASDATSGLATLKVTTDGGSWTDYTAPVTLANGNHTLKFRAADKAGNVMTTKQQSYQVDTNGPDVQLPAQWNLGQTVNYTVQDSVSGLGPLRVVIQDPDWRWPKRVIKDHPQKDKFLGAIDWDGEFGDGTIAPPGTYQAWVKAVDGAGNETRQLGYVTVPKQSLFSPILPTSPTPVLQGPGPLPGSGTGESQPSASTVAKTNPTATPSAMVNNATSGGEKGSVTLGPSRTMAFSAGGVSSAPTSPTDSNILWGTAAAAAIGAFAAEAERRQRARQARWQRHLGKVARWAGKKEPMSYRLIAKAYAAAKRNFNATLQTAKNMGMSSDQVAKLKSDAASSGTIGASLNAANDYIAEKESDLAQLDTVHASAGNFVSSAKEDDYAKLDAVHANAGNISRPQIVSKPWWVPSFSVEAARTLVRSIPSTGITNSRQEIPTVSFLSPEGILSFGQVMTSSSGSIASPNAEISAQGGKMEVGHNPSLSAGAKPGEPELDGGLRFSSPVQINESEVKGSLGYSLKAAVKWEGWNTTITADLNYADVNISTGDVGIKGNMTSGLYLKWKPVQAEAVAIGVLAGIQVVGLVAAAAASFPPAGTVIPELAQQVAKILTQGIRLFTQP